MIHNTWSEISCYRGGVILYNYINELASLNSLNMRAIHISYPVIATSPLKNAKKTKMINLSDMISTLNFVFTILFYATR
jgi:hypothetical protein